MDFVRRLVGSKPKRKPQAQPPQRPDASLNRSRDEATVFRPVPQFEPEPEPEPAPLEADGLGESASRGRPDQLTMMGSAPVGAPEPTGDTGTNPLIAPTGKIASEPQGPEAATVYMQVPPEPEPEPEPPVRRQIASLTATEGELVGQVFAVLQGENQIGRSPDSDIVLASRFVSRVHARLLCNDGKIQFVPVSDQLTMVNGTAAAEQELQDGDEIQLGRTKLQIRVEG